MVFLWILSCQCVEVLSPMVFLPLGSLLVVLESGHASGPRFALRSYMPLRTSLPPTAHIHLFRTGTRFIVPGLPPTRQGAPSTGPSIHINQRTIHLSSTHREGKIWNMGDDFTEGCGRAEPAQPRGRAPVEAAEWVWLWGHTLPEEEGRMGDSDGFVTELPLTPAQAESSEGHLCS